MAKQDLSAYSICEDAQAMLAKAKKDGVETVWDRLKAQEPHCGFCELGLSCRNCVMSRTLPSSGVKKYGALGPSPCRHS